MSSAAQRPAWKALLAHRREIEQLQLRELFAADPYRAVRLSLDAVGLHLDYAKNLVTFLDHLLKEGQLELDLDDEITRGTLITHQGAIVNDTVRSRIASGSGGA